MAKVIAVTNQKGGVGKTSTTEGLGVCLKTKGYRVLCIDLDPQANLSFSVDAETEEFPTIYDVIKGTTKTLHAVQRTPSFDIIASNILLSGVELEFTQKDREFILKKAIEPALRRYDYILIDTPPALSILTVNAFTAADAIIIPMLADIFSLQGVAELHETIIRVKHRYNPELKIQGILLNKYNSRSILTREVMATAELVAEQLNTKIFSKKIRQGCVISEAQANQASFLEYAPSSNVVKDYMKFAEEVLKEDENSGEQEVV